MTTFNRTYRAPKFHLCVHTTDDYHVGYDPAENRYSHYSFLSHGGGRYHALVDGKFETHETTEPKQLIYVGNYMNSHMVGECFENTRIITFNSWRKNEKWEGRLIDSGKIISSNSYSSLICFEGSCEVNGKTIGELEYADLEENKEYTITVNQDSYVGLFELCQII